VIAPFLAVGALLAMIGAFFGGIHYGAAAEIARQAKTDDVVRVVTEAAQQGAAEAIAANKPRNVTIRQQTEREIRENIVYRDCHATAAGVQLVNEALTGQPQPAGGGQLPAASAAK
jgi:hypothetical protein